MQQPLKPYNHPDYNDLPAQFPPDCASAWGEDQYGIWFELRVNQVEQRFRWIPKGEFTMGSPEDEKDRESHERLGKETLHEVSFTQGYWLAETACSQALWQSVMDANPAEFNDDLLNPVEKISWLDTQVFLKKLNQLIPNLKAQLPSEAQWEYACRAGTITPFSFGENITSDQVNYDGNYPYADGEKGIYREKTSPVTDFEANDWGLYQMHGNVWEWCFDEFQKDLGREPVVNPVTARFKTGVKPDKAGSHGKAVAEQSSGLETTRLFNSERLENADDASVFRVLRGGSWYDDGRHCRSAIRYRGRAAGRNGDVGFRFSLGL